MTFQDFVESVWDAIVDNPQISFPVLAVVLAIVIYKMMKR